MADTNMSNLIINEMTYTQAQANAGSIGENELILTTDKNIPIPTTADNGKYVKVDNGDFILETVPDKANVDASNLTTSNVTSWLDKLGVNTKMYLLWENPSPENSFSPQTINLSSSDWDILMIYYIASTGNVRQFFTSCKREAYGAFMSYVNTTSGGAFISIRNFNVNNTTYQAITFENAYTAQGTSAEQTNNIYCIPVAVFGLKFN